MKDLIEKIRRQTTAEAHDDPLHRRVYSVDASIYEIEPLAVAIPKTKADLVTILKLAAEAGVPVVPRGAATGIAGGAIGKGLIVDVSKYLKRILEIGEGYAVVEPGVVQDALNSALQGCRLGPDTSTGNRATIGGMVANNSAGAHSLVYGCMADHVLEVELALAGGGLRRIGMVSEEEMRRDYPELYRIREMEDEIRKKFPKIPRRVSGYALDRLLGDFPINLAAFIAGSEGTLGILTEVKVRTSPLLEKRELKAFFFESMREAMEMVPELLRHDLASLELIDDRILEMARVSPAVKDKLGWVKGRPKAVLVAEGEVPGGERVENPSDVWEVRKAGLGLLLSKRSYNRAIAFIEDVSVPPERLAEFVPEFMDYLGRDAGIYGHAGAGCLHIRPYVNLSQPGEAERMRKIQVDVAEMVVRYGGALSGEHGDGLVRSWLNERLFGEKIYGAFREVKRCFDPKGLMNPGKIVDAPDLLENLRVSPKEGLDVDLCNGNGMCRKMDGLMCPSYQATEDEFDTTRARAVALRAMIRGDLPKNDVGKVLDLCLECKGCKRECPSQVDMARMKSEYLHKRGKHSLRDWVFGHIGTLLAYGSRFPGFANWTGGLMKGLLGIASERELPQLARQKFSEWFAGHRQKGDKRVALFNDTFTEFNHPEIGIAAVKVLNALGYRVDLLPWTCCGRPLISKGFLDEFKEQKKKLKELLQGTVIALEPSCHSALIDEGGFQVELFDTFIAKEKLPLKACREPIFVHGHCHQKALLGMESTLKALRQIPQAIVKEIPSGCCGMAGSFGYEKEHYAISMKIGGLKLFPGIGEGIVVASGTSCRQQIADGKKKRARHLAEILADHLQ